MATNTSITNKITAWITTNGNNDITGAQLHEILDDILSLFSDSQAAYNSIAVNSVDSYTIGNLANGSQIGSKIVSTGDTVGLFGQAVASENGIYTIGKNPGDTARHADFPNAASCANKIFVAGSPDENGNYMLATKMSGAVVIADNVGASTSGTAKGTVTFNTATHDITFDDELEAAPTKKILSFWDTNGMPVVGGYVPASLATTGATIKVPGNDGEEITCHYEFSI